MYGELQHIGWVNNTCWNCCQNVTSSINRQDSTFPEVLFSVYMKVQHVDSFDGNPYDKLLQPV